MENSLSAFRRAVAEGYRYIETDVHATADGILVVHHDTDLDRTTDSRGSIGRLPWSAVRSARIAGREPVCRLEDVLEELPDTFFNIDVKSDPAVPEVLRVVRRQNAWDRVCLAAFSDRRLESLRRDGGPALLTSLGPRSAAAVWAGSRLVGWPLRPLVRGGAAQVPARRGRLRVIDSRFLRLAHRWGLEVHGWTINHASDMAALLDLGVDGLVTDRPDVLRAVLRQRAQWNVAAVPGTES
jgi:glycerophosphoryl diester phosphodiesterase